MEATISATGNPIVLPAVASSGTLASTVKVYAWVPDSDGAATASPATLYTDAACTIAASNPATLGANVRKLYKTAGSEVTIVVKSSDDSVTYDTIHYPVSDTTDATVIAFSALSFSGTNAFLRATASDTFVAESAANHRSALQVGIGTTTNDNATAGYIGEYLSAQANAASVSLTTATAANLTSLSLTAGDWDVWLEVEYAPAATTTVSRFISSISAVSATLNVSAFDRYTDTQYPTSYTPTNSGAIRQNVGPFRASISGTTTYYAIAYAVFGTSTMTAGGLIRARRVR